MPAVCERDIAGRVYQTTLLGSKAGTRMSVRLLKLMGPTTSSFVDGLAGGRGDGEQSIALGVSDALREISTRLTGDELLSLMEELAKRTTVTLDAEHQPRLSDIFDEHFSGKYDEMMAWLKFCLEVNFQSFFGGSVGAAALARRIWTLIESRSKSPPTSTGTSTASPAADTTAQA